MKIYLRNKAGFWLKSKKRKQDTAMPMVLASAHEITMNILILLPRSPVAVRIVKYFLKEIAQESATLKFICFESVYDAFEPNIRGNIMVLKKSLLDFWGLPNDSFVSEVFSEKFNAVVNLDPQFDPVMASIVIGAPVPIRIGFDSDNGSFLYNNLLRVSKDSGFVESGYLAIKKLLGL